ncbi:hypothetical protein ElyMa_003898000 [Elysia marginata]|uniref:Reverse transcriptase domain-containing protein n=1 Tax=Elysia marginata TaxID=1093978 RepID=A0AAV4FMU7_9GAST|nr:hypothetical protein ElyMa_003898000 [Elysia marginata]
MSPLLSLFCARQIQDKCMEQDKHFYTLFVNLIKFFDIVTRTGLCLPRTRISLTAEMIRCFHDGMKAGLVNAKAEDDFDASNGVKQGCVLAPTLFCLA